MRGSSQLAGLTARVSDERLSASFDEQRERFNEVRLCRLNYYLIYHSIVNS